jgi:hypothetical protein
MKITFIKVGSKMTDGEKDKISKSCIDLYKNYLNYEMVTINSTTCSFEGTPIFETTDFPQGKLSFLSGQTMLSIMDKIDTKDLAPIIV